MWQYHSGARTIPLLQEERRGVRLLADGVHFSAETSVEVARRWLVAQLVAAAPETP